MRVMMPGPAQRLAPRRANVLRSVSLLVSFLVAPSTAGCSANVLHGVDERSANEAAAALERGGIGAEALPDESGESGAPRFTVRVARGDGTRARELLRALGLPRPAPRGFAQTYGQPSLIPTPSEERARFLDALAGELERTLESADGIVSARVHLALAEAEAEPLALEDRPRPPARAAVLLKARPGRPPLDEADVRALVSGSVAGLDPGAVSVVLTTAPTAGAPPPLAPLGPLRVTPGTRPLLLAFVAFALALLTLLAALLLVTARRLTALEASKGAEKRAEERAEERAEGQKR